MRLVTGINHVALVTADLERFIEFYGDVFGVEVAFEECAPFGRHAMLRTGDDSVLHPAEIGGNPHGTALPDMFERGHLDHLALAVGSPEAFATVRERALARGASDGVITDNGAVHSIWLRDPDGMSVEVCLLHDPELRSRPIVLTEDPCP